MEKALKKIHMAKNLRENGEMGLSMDWVFILFQMGNSKKCNGKVVKL